MSAGEHEGEIGVEELRELFRRRRPEARAFREAVLRRVREKEAEARGEAEEERPPLRSAFARRVAGFLPPEVAAALSTAGGGKALSLAAALPVLVVLSTVGSFAAGLGSLRRSAVEAVPPPRESARRESARKSTRPRALFGAQPPPLRPELALGGKLLALSQWGALLVLAGAFLLGSSIALDLLCAFAVVSMGSLALSVRGLGRAGLLARGEVAALACAVLTSAFCGLFLWQQGLPIPDLSELGLGWSALLVLCGFVACAWVARRESAGRAGWPTGIVAWSFLVLLLNPVGCTRSSPGELRASFPRLATDAGQIAGWREAAATLEALRGAGCELPDTRATRALVQRALEDGLEAHPVVWTAAARMELVDEDGWRRLAARPGEARALETLVREEAGFDPTDYYAYRVPMLLAARPPSAEEREVLVEKLERMLDGSEQGHPLSYAATGTHLLELLGREDVLERHREALRTLLVRHWISGEERHLLQLSGGFTYFPEEIRASVADATWDALELMKRVGAPAEIDLRLVRSFLRKESRAFLFGFEPWPRWKARARAGLLRLERELGLAPRPFWRRLVDERLALAVLLLVALCLAAVRLAPSARAQKRHTRTGSPTTAET